MPARAAAMADVWTNRRRERLFLAISAPPQRNVELFYRIYDIANIRPQATGCDRGDLGSGIPLRQTGPAHRTNPLARGAACSIRARDPIDLTNADPSQPSNRESARKCLSARTDIRRDS